jgi:hypothetical protein
MFMAHVFKAVQERGESSNLQVLDRHAGAISAKPPLTPEAHR